MHANTFPAAHGAGLVGLRLALPSCAAAVLMAGCGGSGGGQAAMPPASGAPPTTILTLSAGPTNQSVPMGLTATFSVTASATASPGPAPTLQYQWFDNGQAISGATSSTYTTPATAFMDSGSQFTVTVSGGGVSLTSAPATLTVTARAPNPQDLRFQLVDSPSTVSGYVDAGSDTTDSSVLSNSFTSIGTPLWLGTACSVSTSTDPQGCERHFDLLTPSQPGLIAGYSAGDYELGLQILQGEVGGSIPADWPVSSSSVVTSLDLDSLSLQYALSWLQDMKQTDFDMKLEMVDATNLPSAVAQDAAASRVVTAISYNGGQVAFLSYGWQKDTATVYETEVITVAAPSDAAAAAATLAQQGYIITAYGRADATGTAAYYLVGTRVVGDTMPRPFMTAQSTVAPLAEQGYAVVAVINDPSAPAASNPTFLGER